jgi:hypothetical protein
VCVRACVRGVRAKCRSLDLTILWFSPPKFLDVSRISPRPPLLLLSPPHTLPPRHSSLSCALYVSCSLSLFLSVSLCLCPYPASCIIPLPHATPPRAVLNFEATNSRGLQLPIYEALSYVYIRPSAASVLGLQLLLYKALSC